MPNQDFTICLVQTDIIWENPEANQAHISKLLAPYAREADLILLPEMWNTGFTRPQAHLAEQLEHSENLAYMQALAERYKVAVGGSMMVAENGNFYNRFFWVRPAPYSDLMYYDKRHLFRMAGENKYFKAGDKRKIFSYKNWNFMPQVCYDLRFPVFSRNRYNTNQNTFEYDVILYVANFPAARAKAWNVLLCARAIENSAYTVGLNRVGKDGNGILYKGESAVYDAKGDCLNYIGKQATAQNITISAQHLNRYREKFAVHLDADSFNIHNN
ncbi:MAG: nitrilase family protein [Bernardetiaceae bacterium]|nr:nitrilase family protein [Bernardetiaceae bacterium]